MPMTRHLIALTDIGLESHRMRTMGHAIDRYVGELARRGCSDHTRRKYFGALVSFADTLADDRVAEVTVDDCRRFLDRYVNHAPATMALHITVLNTFFAFMLDENIIDRSPMERVRRPRLPKAEDRDVVTIGTDDVIAMFAACESWQERLCLGVLAYLGPRRSAATKLRWSDVNLRQGTMRFAEKGRKITTKPMPGELVQLLEHARLSGAVPCEPDDYVIPNRRAASVRNRDRSSKFIWETVRIVAARAGIKAHPHAVRAAFATHFLDTQPREVVALQTLLGHESISTTMVYLRRLNRTKAMDTVRTLSWAPESAPTETAADPKADRRDAPATPIAANQRSLPTQPTLVGELAAARRRSLPSEAMQHDLSSGATGAPVHDVVLRASRGVPHTGFEPVLQPQAHPEPKAPEDTTDNQVPPC